MLEPRNDRGSALVETVFAIVLLLVLVLGVVEVVFALYARNVVASSAHEGARAAIELGSDPASAEDVVRDVVERSAGGLVRRLDVATSIVRTDKSRTIRVLVRGSLVPFGPVPLSIPFSTTARASRASSLR
ncbi:MAG: TadE/TadG family type IV pilus assembly protein [Actinomycetota bacterium]